jgi:hypothetical protein
MCSRQTSAKDCVREFRRLHFPVPSKEACTSGSGMYYKTRTAEQHLGMRIRWHQRAKVGGRRWRSQLNQETRARLESRTGRCGCHFIKGSRNNTSRRISPPVSPGLLTSRNLCALFWLDHSPRQINRQLRGSTPKGSVPNELASGGRPY